MFWVDFNFGFLSVVVTCQVEGATAVNDMLATLTCHMHTYTLEMKYGSVEEVRDLFSMPLNEESYALLSSVVFLEFSPLEMLEKLCYHIFGSKLKVLHLEPEGCKAKKHSKVSHEGPFHTTGRHCYEFSVVWVAITNVDDIIYEETTGKPSKCLHLSLRHWMDA
ncbi:hypothetical protein E2C01_025371 [Portunus trituberculatus]|uniref:Uncharacterized protein n=1 Tax=Portunus trituberculatus TaxID=210409 RepID=A0A5B7EFF3_PORTR|nr:hypothetical protein [Portunus trituberculatus]